MGAQLRSLPLLLLLLLTFQEMIPSEAQVCQARSRSFHGPCFNRKNCSTICEKDGFSSGKCKMFKCVCQKECNAGGEEPGGGPPASGGGDEEPGEDPPAPGGEQPDDGAPKSGGGGSLTARSLRHFFLGLSVHLLLFNRPWY